MNKIAEPDVDVHNNLNFGLIKVSGEDNLSFLQGQLSNDINELLSSAQRHSTEDNGPEIRWHYSGYCNQKGRLIALFKVWREGNDILMLTSKDLVENVSDRLRKYVMRSKVIIEAFEAAKYCGIASLRDLEGALDIPTKSLFDKMMSNSNAVLSMDMHTILKIGNRYLVVDKSACLQNNDADETHAQMLSGAKILSNADWLAAQISDGLPNISLDSSELFIPQMLNLDLLGGINFKKGCYTGQEIVARMHYLGKLKQRMFVCDLMEGDTDAMQPGSNIYNDAELSKPIGTVVSSVPSSDKLLAVLRLTELENTLFTGHKTVIKVAATQPYEIPLALTE